MKKRFQLSGNMKNVAKISSGTVLGQLISILTLPLITRIYGASILGVWTTIYAIANLINMVSDLGMTQSVMICKEENAPKTLGVLLLLTGSISLLAAPVVGIYCYFVIGYGWGQTLTVILFAVLYGLSLQLSQVCYTWLNRNKQYSALMKNPVLNYLSMAVITLTLGYLGFEKYGYFIGMTVAQMLTLLHMLRFMPRKLPRISRTAVGEVIRENKEFVKYQLPSNMAYQFREQLPNLLIGGLFGDAILGCYSVSLKLLNIPVTFIGQALGKVFYQRLAELKQKGQQVSDFIYRNISRAMKLAIIPMILLAAFGDAAVVMFFGEVYAMGGVIVRIVAFRAVFTFISTSTQGMDIVLGKQRYAMLCCLAQTGAMALAIAGSFYLTHNIYWCAVIMTVFFIVIQVTYFCAIFKTVEIRPLRYLKSIGVSLAVVLVAAFALRAAYIWIMELTGWGLLEYLGQFLVR